jgi:predicted PurR-regulated permease PerM
MAKDQKVKPETTVSAQPVHTPRVPRHIKITMLVAVTAGFFFVLPYLGAIMFSALIAFIFNPVYKSVLRRTHRDSIAIPVTLLTAFLSVMLPLFFVVAVTVNQANTLINNFQDGNVNIGPAQIETVVEHGTERINDITKALPGGKEISINQGDIAKKLQDVAAAAVKGLLNFIKNAGGAFFGLISTFILALFMIIAMWRYQDDLIAFLKKISPYHESVNQLYLARTGAMTKAMVKGQLIIAVCQGFASAFSLWIVGLDYFWFFFVILTFLSFIPLGGGILTIPIGIIMALTGHFWAGLFIVLFHLIVVSNIDNLLRPRLVPKDAQLNSALTLLAVFSGLAVFGPAGVIYGPVVMILLITTFKMYAEYNARIQREEPPAKIA